MNNPDFYDDEGELQCDCLKYCVDNRIFHLRINTMGVFDTHIGAYRKSPNTKKGVADILVIKNNVPIFIELKDNKGKLNEDQILFRDSCSIHNIQYHVARSLTEFINICG